MKPIPAGLDFDTPIDTKIESLLNSAKIDLHVELSPPPTALKISGETFGTLGNFSLVIGKAKSKKTFLMALGMAGALGSNGIFEGCLPPDKNRVIFCDTEQGNYHVLKTGKNVLRLLRTPEIPDNFDVYALRKYDTQTRLELIEHLIQNTPDLGLLVIDGIKDLISSINNEDEASKMSDYLLNWTEVYQIHIVTVLHQNKKDANARGHIGSELVNKAETVVSVEVEPKTEVSKVEAEYTRNKEFSPFGFMIDSFGLPEIVEGWKPKDTDKAKNKGASPGELDDFKHKQILRHITRYGEKFTNTELIEQIILAVSECYEQIGRNKALTFKTYYENEYYVKKHGKAHSPKAFYTVHPDGIDEDEKGTNDDE